ncbi:hypothetical protein Tco_0790444 [Tanacetum coccineum]
MSARIAEAAALSPSSFCKRYRSSYETPSPSSSLTLPIQKRYWGTSELVEDTENESSDSNTKGGGLKDEGPISEDEEATTAPRPPVRATWVDPVDGTVYTDILIDVPPVRIPVQTPSSPEWSPGSQPVSPSSPAVPTQ